MKKLYSTIMMLAMMVAALSFTACGDDDDDDGGSSTTGDYLRVTLDGKTYSDKILNWDYAQIDPVGRDDNNKP